MSAKYVQNKGVKFGYAELLFKMQVPLEGNARKFLAIEEQCRSETQRREEKGYQPKQREGPMLCGNSWEKNNFLNKIAILVLCLGF